MIKSSRGKRRRTFGVAWKLVLLAACIVLPFGCNADTLVLGTNHETINPGKARQRFVEADGRRRVSNQAMTRHVIRRRGRFMLFVGNRITSYGELRLLPIEIERAFIPAGRCLAAANQRAGDCSHPFVGAGDVQ